MSHTVENQEASPTVAHSEETFGFQAEVSQVLDLVVHALYSKQEIFLRELLANASDALDKRRFERLQHPEWPESDAPLRVRIESSAEQNLLCISDTGIGMTREDIVSHLGTIAQSGTRAFVERLQSAAADTTADSMQLIGQFGVGFYAVFMVADAVEVISRHASAAPDEAVSWASTGKTGFTVRTVSKATVGTEVRLTLKPDAQEFLQPYRLREIVRTYSEHLAFPIELLSDQPAPEAEESTSTEPVWEQINQPEALWRLPKKDITDSQYCQFYQQHFHDFTDPLIWQHNRTEGTLDYTSLLFIPARPPFSWMQKDAKMGLQLYIQRMLVMDDVSYFLPEYLRFVRGVLDCSDLPLNVSRELLQKDKKVEQIKKALTKKVLHMLGQLAQKEEDYLVFWKAFGRILKEGSGEDKAHVEQILPLLRFHSSRDLSQDAWVSLADYVARMDAGTDQPIYYLVADSWGTLQDNPHLEWYKARNIEVLLLHDRIDEWMVGQLPPFEGKAWKAINARTDTPSDAVASESELALTEADKQLLSNLQSVLSQKVTSVQATAQLVGSPACIRMGNGSWSVHMQKWMQSMGESVPDTKPVLEIHLEHPFIRQLAGLDAQSDTFRERALFLYQAAYLAETGHLEEPMAFLKPVYDWLADMPRNP